MTTIDKPRVRVQARSADSFANFQARLGVSTANLSAGSTYTFNPISRNRVLLENMYRGSWLVGQAVDIVAEDMTRSGISIETTLPPDDTAAINGGMERLCIWQALNDTIKWSRLYGGCIAVVMIDGQNISTPLKIDTVAKDQFKGLMVLDRWLVTPSLDELITDFGPDYGYPKYYTVVADAPGLRAQKIHYSRCIRLDGVTLPYWQRISENGWGMSVVERLYDRLVAFDSTTQGAAQLVHKAHLRTYSVDGLRDIIGAGGPAYEGLLKQIEMIRLFQSIEGMTLMDMKDKFEAHSYSFSGLSDVMLQFGQQLSGALQIPLVRLFGQSPAGLNSTGDADIRTYYDMIQSQQESRLRRGIGMVLDLLCRSELGSEPPKGLNYTFTPLWQMTPVEKATVGQVVATAVTQAVDSGIITEQVGLKELRQSSHATGMFSNITDEDINNADTDPPEPDEPPTGAIESEEDVRPGGAE
ncbi:DUF1073 domain-containing protein [Ochrobactrum chromiisoli]|uniref:DUF1073 domain-containing protein n=1 Tax=Ochrobactrum chromiisoli TaxID=2993941 RepID=A0ABT3QUG1_9HYPH|nr:DUF1073 domain-containing protein [Ochrobactrum chromiisoli]MCX2699244.1 DUF1073 domain-containing protein [Ochrobactrum chromiisoli]